MPITFDSIATITIASPTTSISFTNIPATFTDLVLHSYSRANTTGLDVYCRVNGSSTLSDYMVQTIDIGSSTSPSVASSRGGSTGGWYFDNYGYVVAENFSPNFVYIPNYCDSNWQKTFLSQSTHTGPSQLGVSLLTGSFNSTSNITTLEMRSNSSSEFAVGANFALYGIKKA